MKGAMVAAVLAAILLLPLAATPAAAERGLPPREAPMVEHGRTERFAGGEWVRVRIGDVSLGVIWSTEGDLRRAGVRLFLDYARYFGGAELYDEQGDYLRTIPLPLHTVLIQEFGKMIEYHDADGDGRFDLSVRDRTSAGDYPLKALNLSTAWFLDGEIEQVVTDDAAWVNFTVSAENVSYAEVFDPVGRAWRRGTPADGALDRISLTFRLAAEIREGSAVVPFYKITLADGNERTPASSEFLGNRTMTGRAFTVDGKYDQLIEGWDFSGDPDARLALGTHLSFGNLYTRPIVQWLQQQFGGACLKDGTFQHCESEDGPTQPQIIERTELNVAEGWHRAGRWYWVSEVTVDGAPARMTFEIYFARRVDTSRDGAMFQGFQAFGAFVYPQGQTIAHDPGLSASALLAPIFETANLAPSILTVLQLAVVGIALVPALLLRRRAAKRGP